MDTDSIHEFTHFWFEIYSNFNIITVLLQVKCYSLSYSRVEQHARIHKKWWPFSDSKSAEHATSREIQGHALSTQFLGIDSLSTISRYFEALEQDPIPFSFTNYVAHCLVLLWEKIVATLVHRVHHLRQGGRAKNSSRLTNLHISFEMPRI